MLDVHPRRLVSRINSSFFDPIFKNSTLSVVHPRSAAFGPCARTRWVSKHASCVLLSPRACACTLCACACPLERGARGVVFFFFCAFWPTRQRHKRGQARKSTRTFRFPPISRTTVLLLGSPSARCVDAIGRNRSRRVHLCAEAVLARVPLRPVHKRQRAARGGTCVRVSRGRSRGELGRSSRTVQPRASRKTHRRPRQRSPRVSTLCCCVALCVFRVVIHRRVSAGAARPWRPPLSRGCFLQKMASSPSCFLPGRGCETQRKHSPRGFPAASASRLHFPDEAARLPAVFLQAVRRLGRDLAPRKDAQRWEGGHRCCAPSWFLWLRKKGGTAARETRRGFLFCLISGLPRHRYRGEATRASTGMLHLGFVCVFLTRVSSSLRRTAAMLASSGRGRRWRRRRRGLLFTA